MRITRRKAIGLMAAAIPAARAAELFGAQQPAGGVQAGPLQATRESLAAYRIPEWFRDAKFGIWAHWGPQSSAEAGDWYARNMYIQGSPQYEHHLKHYGHPSKFGFKDVIPTWKGEKFDPDYLVGLYKKAGAKYFVSMGVHHDNFDLWNSKHNRWNAANMGPKKDIVGSFRRAALNHGLHFGVSDHLWISYKWFAVSHLSDKEGPYAGVPYDGADPQWADLYHSISDPKLLTTKLDWSDDGFPETWKQHWFLRIKDLIDQYDPDLVYCDGDIPFQQHGLDLVAYFYNQNARRRGGKAEAVYTSKRKEDCQAGTCVLDRERGVVEGIWPNPFQTDTCIGQWHYARDIQYKSPKMVIDMLVDVVSRNGNLLLNFPLPSDGMLDEKELAILAEITRWMAVNGEAIYGTRPWKTFGEGPGTAASAAPGDFNENKRKDLTTEDVRFTTKGATLYAFVMGWPEKQAIIAPLATGSKYSGGKIENVELVGLPGKLEWQQDDAGVKVQLPGQRPSDHAVAFRISGAGLV